MRVPHRFGIIFSAFGTSARLVMMALALAHTAMAAAIDPKATCALPEQVTTPLPANNGLASPIALRLSWEQPVSKGLAPCQITYDVFLGTSPASLEQISANQVDTTCLAPPLQVRTTYYWQVIARNEAGSTPRPVWYFKTVGDIATDDVVTMAEDTPTLINVLANDMSSAPLRIVSYTQPGRGQLVKNEDDTFTYTPPLDFNGQTQFGYSIPPTAADSLTTATVTITVSGVNDPPRVVTPLPDVTLPTSPPSQDYSAAGSFKDPENDTIAYKYSYASAEPNFVTITNKPTPGDFAVAFAANVHASADIYVRATDTHGEYVQDSFRVVVGTPPSKPVVTKQPVPAEVNYNDTLTFTCAGRSNTPVRYQWQVDGADILSDAFAYGWDTDTLTIVQVAKGWEGEYRCKIYNSERATYTEPAALKVNDPTITLEPVDVNGARGGKASFNIQTLGSGVRRYQWFVGRQPLKEGSKYSGTTTTKLTIYALQDGPLDSDEQYYHCEIKGADPKPVASRAVFLRVSDPAIVTQPTDHIVRFGQTYTLSAGVEGTQPLEFHWRRNGVFLEDNSTITGTHTSALRFKPTQLSDDADYDLVVVGPETVQSNTVHITVTQMPAIAGVAVTPPDGIVGQNGTISLKMSLERTESNLIYAWMRNGVLLPSNSRYTGIKTGTLTIKNMVVADEGDYVCRLGDGFTYTYSKPVRVQVGFAFSVDLADALMEAGERLVWHTAVTNAPGDVAFAWYKKEGSKAFLPLNDDGRIESSDTDTLTIDPVQFSDEGKYIVHATSGAETISSNVATMHVVAQVPLAGLGALMAVASALGLSGAWYRRRHATPS